MIPVLSYPQFVEQQAKEHALWRQQAGVDEDDTEDDIPILFRRSGSPVTGNDGTPTTGHIPFRNPFRRPEPRAQCLGCGVECFTTALLNGRFCANCRGA